MMETGPGINIGNPGSSSSHGLQKSQIVTAGLKVLLSAIFVGFVLVLFVLFFHIFANWSSNRSGDDSFQYPTTRSRRRRRFAFASTRDTVTVMDRGLEPSILGSIPILIFRSHEFKDSGIQCAVCLCDLLDGEKARLLPKCNHGFHVDCIDMWFKSHKTCPLCRNPISIDESTESNYQARDDDEENNCDSTNMAFQGNQNQSRTVEAGSPSSPSPSSSGVSSRRDGTLAIIEIPTRISEDFAVTSGSAADEEFKSPTTPRFRSLKRLLSRGKRSVGNCSPRMVDVERGQEERNQCSGAAAEAL